jgi:hypothetical protein
MPNEGRSLTALSEKNIYKGNILKKEILSSPDAPEDRIFLDYGVMIEANTTFTSGIPVNFDFKKLGAKKETVCKMYGCENLQDFPFDSEKPTRVKFEVNENELNLQLMNIAKLFSISDEELDVQTLTTYLSGYKTSNKNIEIKGVMQYLDFINSFENDSIGYVINNRNNIFRLKF